MSNENNKVTRITVDLSTSVKPIAVTEEEALKKLEQDNKSQAQFKDDTIEIPPVEVEEQEETKPTTKDVMKEMNESFDEVKFNKTNQTLGYQTPEERKKQITIVLAIIAGIILLILLLELPAIIKNFS